MSERTIATKAVILSRVSSKDQEDGYSLEVQTDRLEKYCVRKDLRIINKFQIVESSTQGDRKKFMEIIKFIKAQRETIALVADKVDRIQRSQKETPILDELIKKGNLELHFNSEGYIIHNESTAHEMMMWGMGVVIAKSHTDLLSENVKKSFKRKIETYGEWYGHAPLGYLNKRDERGRSMIIIDPVRAPIIEKFFTEYATGVYTLPEMAIKVNKWGLRTKDGRHISKSSLYHMIQNSFYYGQMKIKGEIWPHCHGTIISREVFKACEAVRRNWGRKPFQCRSREFIFKGILKCAITGTTVSAETKTKTYNNGKIDGWTYLRTFDPKIPNKRMWVREDNIIGQLEEVLKNLCIKDPILLKQTMEYLTVVNDGKSHEFNREVAAFKEEHTKIQTKLDKLVDLLAEGILSKEDFMRKKDQLKERQYELTEILASYDKVDDKFSKKLASLINIASGAYETFKGSTIAEKRELLNFIFANLQLRGQKLEHTLAFPFSELTKLTNCSTYPG